MVRVDAGCIQARASRMAANCKHATEKSKVTNRRRAWPLKPPSVPELIYLADGLAPHPRHQRSPLYWHQCVKRMLSDVSRRRRGALRDGATGDPGDRPAIVEFRLIEPSGPRTCLRRCHELWQATAYSDIVFKDRNVLAVAAGFSNSTREFRGFPPWSGPRSASLRSARQSLDDLEKSSAHCMHR